MNGYRQLLKDDLSMIFGGADNVFSPISIKRVYDGVSGELNCAVTELKDEMLLQNYRLFEVDGGEGLYLDNRHLSCLKDDWLAIFGYIPYAKQKYIIDGHMFEIRTVTTNLDVFLKITMASLRT